jgi:membrane protein YqaA with SNARE-associated domain
LKAFVKTLSTWGPWGIFLLAALDSAGIPLPAAVDALLLVIATTDRADAYLAAALASIGSVIGSMILFFIARKGGKAYLDRHTMSGKGALFREWFLHYGLLTVFVPALSPVPTPMKLFVICAGAMGISPWSFFFTVLAARIPRYFGLAYLGSKLGEGAWGYLMLHKWEILAALGALFALLYAGINILERRRLALKRSV